MGRNKYLPDEVILELKDIKSEHKIKSDCLAFRKMVTYGRVGREVERIIKLDFSHKPTRKKGGRSLKNVLFK